MLFPTLQELKKRSFTGLEQNPPSPFYRFFKRFFDVIFAALLLIIFLPFWLLIILIIRLSSPGKAIFKHERIGKNGRPFLLYKFRTMYEGSKDQEFAPLSSHDSRITPIGRFLRRTSLDEIPQLYDVIKGEMALVGPRPEMAFIVKNYTPQQRLRLLVKPGLTGLWQILGRKDLPLHENVEYDLYYIQNQSLVLDFVILIRTIGVVISGKGAY